ncbi:hypothetical protein [Demequina oxidasica]|uniref:hypothetical protein n=1 Tax=Demequina oxidasica TaxID=676199 RepID=UPI0007837BEB|nr:hypothetical protein [Demequina oxidasica]
MAKNNKRKYAAIALGIVGIAGLGLASAAQLTVNQSSPLVGIGTDNGCDTNGVDVSYTSSFANNAFKVDTVKVSGIDANCANKTITVYVQNNAATPVTLGTAAGNITGTSVTLTPTPTSPATKIDPANVYGAAVSIS